MKDYTEYILEQAQKLLSIDSPSGYTRNVTDWLLETYSEMGYQPQRTAKGGVLVQISEGAASPSEDPAEGPILLTGHVDTLGAMVSSITDQGTLKLTPLGGMNPNNAETENCRIITREEKTYTGTFQLCNASIHVNGEYNDTKRTYKDMEVLLDELVSTKEEVKALGIMTGDIVCFDPRTVITPSRRIYQHITVFEEVGHGGCGSVPADVTEMLAVDMGCVGEGLECTECQVSICTKDSRGPSHYDVVSALIQAARKADVDFAVDVYPYYGSDVDAALSAGVDARHCLIGPGVYASHGYERSHKEGVKSTFDLLKSYLG